MKDYLTPFRTIIIMIILGALLVVSRPITLKTIIHNDDEPTQEKVNNNPQLPVDNNSSNNNSTSNPQDNKESKPDTKKDNTVIKEDNNSNNNNNNSNSNNNNNNVVDTKNEIPDDSDKYTVDTSRSSDPKYNAGFVMPDIYNTGYTSRYEDLVDFSKKYPNISGCTITAKNAAQYNYTFEGFKTDCQITIRGVDNITIRNFYINGSTYYGINIVAYNGEKYPENTVITDGEIVGTKAAGIRGDNVTIKRVYIHDYNADALKFGSNQVIEGNYIASGGLGEGAHADGIQLTGTANNSIVRGNRFDMVGVGNYKANATIFIKLEQGSSNGVSVVNNWLNGGGYTTYIVQKQEVAGNLTNLTYTNNKIGNGYKFGTLSHDKSISVNGLNNQLYLQDLQVPVIGSIAYYTNNSRIRNLDTVNKNLKILVNSANYTYSDLTIKVVSRVYDESNRLIKKYENTNTIKKTYNAKENNNVSLKDYPSNVPTIIEINDLPTLSKGYHIDTKVYLNNYELRSDTIRKN